MLNSRIAPRTTGLAIIGIGLCLITFSLMADMLDVGGGRGFGYQQLIVFIVGIVLMLGGGAMLLQIGRGHNGNGYRPDNDPNTGF